MNGLWVVIAVIVGLWLLGVGFKIGGSLIHALLIFAVIVLAVQLITGRR